MHFLNKQNDVPCISQCLLIQSVTFPEACSTDILNLLFLHFIYDPVLTLTM